MLATIGQSVVFATVHRWKGLGGPHAGPKAHSHPRYTLRHATVLAEARCGDTLLATGLAHAPVEYYMRRLHAPACVRFERFPADMVNWTGRIVRPDVRAAVERDAEVMADRLKSRDGVWVFTLTRGLGYEATTILEPALRRVLSCTERQALRGAFFDGVLRCAPS